MIMLMWIQIGDVNGANYVVDDDNDVTLIQVLQMLIPEYFLALRHCCC